MTHLALEQFGHDFFLTWKRWRPCQIGEFEDLFGIACVNQVYRNLQ